MEDCHLQGLHAFMIANLQARYPVVDWRGLNLLRVQQRVTEGVDFNNVMLTHAFNAALAQLVVFYADAKHFEDVLSTSHSSARTVYEDDSTAYAVDELILRSSHEV